MSLLGLHPKLLSVSLIPTKVHLPRRAIRLLWGVEVMEGTICWQRFQTRPISPSGIPQGPITTPTLFLFSLSCSPDKAITKLWTRFTRSRRNPQIPLQVASKRGCGEISLTILTATIYTNQLICSIFLIDHLNYALNGILGLMLMLIEANQQPEIDKYIPIFNYCNPNFFPTLRAKVLQEAFQF